MAFSDVKTRHKTDRVRIFSWRETVFEKGQAQAVALKRLCHIQYMIYFFKFAEKLKILALFGNLM